jgi:hypothetical protein
MQGMNIDSLTYTSHSFPSSPHVVINVFRTPACLFLDAITLALTASKVNGKAAQNRVQVQAAAIAQLTTCFFFSFSFFIQALTCNPGILASHLPMLINLLRINVGCSVVIVPKNQFDIMWHRIHQFLSRRIIFFIIVTL